MSKRIFLLLYLLYKLLVLCMINVTNDVSPASCWTFCGKGRRAKEMCRVFLIAIACCVAFVCVSGCERQSLTSGTGSSPHGNKVQAVGGDGEKGEANQEGQQGQDGEKGEANQDPPR